MEEKLKDISESVRRERRVPTVSTILPDGAIVEMVYDPEARATAFIVGRDGTWTREASVVLGPERRLVPYSPENNLLRNGVVLFASAPEEYGTERDLVAAIRAFLHRYVDVSPRFETIASYYVLLSWVYDGFNELPYLRVRGDYGSGKTRALLTIGSLCYKPIFASGASTVSPLFRLLDTFRGTLVIDEGDFRMSDEKAEVVKILNNGNARGFPVLRSEVTGKKGEFDPRAYQVFGPKLIASRGFFDDKALESRFITEEMGERRLRDDIPINLPRTHAEEALRLRNRLLLFRLRHLGRAVPTEALVDRTIEPRLNQVYVPLLAVVEDETVRAELRAMARRTHEDLIADRTMETEAHILEIIMELVTDPETPQVAIAEITRRFTDRHGEDYERKITTRWIGSLVRRKLGLKAQKREGVFVLPVSEFAKLPRLREKYGIVEETSQGEEGSRGPRHPVDIGDFGDVVRGGGRPDGVL
jgi:hypothetical protein